MRIVTVCMECMRKSLSGCVCDLLYKKKVARMMVKSGAALMSHVVSKEEAYGGSLGRKEEEGGRGR